MAHRTVFTAVIASVLFAGTAGVVFAQATHDEVIAKRRATMTASMRSNGTLNAALKAGNATPETIAALKGEADKVHTAFVAMSDMALWPKGSGQPEVSTGTKAKAEIWTDAAGFKAALDGAVAASGKLKAAGDAGDVEGMKAGVAGVQAACSSCHAKYRS